MRRNYMFSRNGRFNIGQVIGSGLETRFIITSGIMAITLFFYIYSIGSYFEIHVFSLFKRVTYDFSFNIHVINKEIDNALILVLAVSLLSIFLFIKRGPYWFTVIQLVYISACTLVLLFGDDSWLQYLALLSLPIMVSSIFLFNFSIGTPRAERTRRLVLPINYFAFICLLVGSVGLIIVGARLLHGGADLIPARNYMYEQYLLFSSLSSYLVFILILCFPIRVLLDGVKRLTAYYHLWSKDRRVSPDAEDSKQIREVTIPVIHLGTGMIILCLVLCMLLSILLVIIPHWADLGTESKGVPRIIGSDTPNYAYTLRTLLERNSTLDVVKQSFLISFGTDPKAFHGDRPLALLFLIGLAYVQPQQIENVIDNTSLILAPALILTIFFLTRELTSNDVVSVLAAFLSSLSFIVLAGMYGGYYANWLGLILGYLSLIFLIKSLRKPLRRNLAIFFILTALMMLSHIYTWFEFIVFEAIFVLVLLKLNYYCRKKILSVGILISITPVVYLGMQVVIGGLYPSQVPQGVLHQEWGLGLSQFASRWESLFQAIHIENGGVFANFVILGLAVYWVFRANTQELSSIFLITFLSIGIIPMFFGNYIIQARILYNFPFQIPAAIGLFYIQKYNINGKIFLVTICIWLFALSLRFVENLIFVSPYSAFNE